jgi:hypothetical protein
MPIVLKSGSLNLLESSGPVQTCVGLLLEKIALEWTYSPEHVTKFCKTNFFIINVVVFDWNDWNGVFRLCLVLVPRCVPSQSVQVVPGARAALCAFTECSGCARCSCHAVCLHRVFRLCQVLVPRCVPSQRPAEQPASSDVSNFQRYYFLVTSVV